MGRYLLGLWDATPDVNPIVFFQRYVGRIETPYSVDRWMFSSAANQQIQFDLMNATTSSIRYKLTGPDGWIGFGDLSGDSAPISLPASGTYMIEATGTAEQSGSYAFRLLNTTPTALPLDTTYQGTIFSSGQPQISGSISLPANICSSSSTT